LLLNKALGQLIDWQRLVEKANETPLEYGYARLDAFGHIFNKVMLRLKASDQFKNPSDAPVSYPFIWNTHQQDKVQWNGIAPNNKFRNFEIGALGRNVGEVTGVFADLTLLPFGPAVNGYITSANVKNLVLLEQQLASLKPPAWPSEFPKINADSWEKGRALFRQEGKCIACHKIIRRDDLTTEVNVDMTPLVGKHTIGTDPAMACNALMYKANTGLLRGTPNQFIVFSSLPFGKTASVAELLKATVIGSIYFKKEELLESDLRNALKETTTFSLSAAIPEKTTASDDGTSPKLPQRRSLNFEQPGSSVERNDRIKLCLSAPNALLAYKGRPLEGIWASPPFLHNGSVPTLFDLLLPPEKRPSRFSLGTREYDPEKVGYVYEASKEEFKSADAKRDNKFVFNTIDSDGNPIIGNSNAGHDYGNAEFSDEQRYWLVEYMKAISGTRQGNIVVP